MNRTEMLVVVAAVFALPIGCGRESSEPGPDPHAGHSAAAAASSERPAEPLPSQTLPPGYAAVEADQGRLQELGVTTMRVRRVPIGSGIRTVGVVQNDETRTSHVHVKFDGFIEQLHVNYTGQAVRKGQPLLRIFSRELLAAQQEYLASRSALPPAAASGSEAARAAGGQLAAASRERLRLFDVPGSVLARIDRTGVAERAITILSPRSGTVIEKQALPGLAVTPMDHLFVIADLSRVWVLADVYERDLAQVKVGQKAELALEAMPGRTFVGAVTFLSPVVEPSTRTVKVRFEFSNRDGQLRPGMYATVMIATGQGEGLVIPSDSVMDTGQRKLVFVSRGAGRFEPRAVVTAPAGAGQYQVLEGLAEGELIASSGQFLLDSESRLRAAQTSGTTAPGHGGH